MGVHVINSDADRCRREFAAAVFAPSDTATYAEQRDRLWHRFAVRSDRDDQAAFTPTFAERLYPDDLAIIDMRPEACRFQRVRSGPAFNTLVRTDPGPPREQDIAVLLRRIFSAENIYLNPFRTDTGKELTDVMVITDHVMLFIEAKDSPNTAASLERSLQRKKQSVQKHVEKAVKQLRGGLSYALEQGGVTIVMSDGSRTLPSGNRQLLGLVVVSEMFDDRQLENSEPVLHLVDDLQLPVMLIDYPGLRMVTLNLRTPEHFVGSLHDLFDVAIEQGQFPRSVWGGPPPSA